MHKLLDYLISARAEMLVLYLHDFMHCTLLISELDLVTVRLL